MLPPFVLSVGRRQPTEVEGRHFPDSLLVFGQASARLAISRASPSKIRAWTGYSPYQ